MLNVEIGTLRLIITRLIMSFRLQLTLNKFTSYYSNAFIVVFEYMLIIEKISASVVNPFQLNFAFYTP